MALLTETDAEAVAVLVFGSKRKGSGAAPAFLVRDPARLVQLQRAMALAMREIAEDLEAKANAGGGLS
jgi:hypothetical protein